MVTPTAMVIPPDLPFVTTKLEIPAPPALTLAPVPGFSKIHPNTPPRRRKWSFFFYWCECRTSLYMATVQ